MSEPNIMAMSTIRTCSSQLVASTFSSVMIVVHRFCTWIAPSDVDLLFSLILVTKTSAVEGETTSAACLHYHCNQSIHVTDGVAVTSILLASNTRQVWAWTAYAKSY